MTRRKTRKPHTAYKPNRIPWFLMAAPMPKEQVQRNELTERLSWKAIETGTATEKEVIHVQGVILFAQMVLPKIADGETLKEDVEAGRNAISEILSRTREGRPYMNSDVVAAGKAFDIGEAALRELDRREIDEIIGEDFKSRGQWDVYLGFHQGALKRGL